MSIEIRERRVVSNKHGTLEEFGLMRKRFDGSSQDLKREIYDPGDSANSSLRSAPLTRSSHAPVPPPLISKGRPRKPYRGLRRKAPRGGRKEPHHQGSGGRDWIPREKSAPPLRGVSEPWQFGRETHVLRGRVSPGRPRRTRRRPRG